MPLARRPVRALAVLLVALTAAVALLTAARSDASARTSSASSTPAASSTRAPAVPQGFVGVDVDGPLIADDSSLTLTGQLGTMVASGVESIRIAFNWAAAQPYQRRSDVPTADRGHFTDVRGAAYDFRATDAVVAAAARRRVSVLPTVLYAPRWDAVVNRQGVDYPRRTGPYTAYLTALIGRYGPRGSFWRANPGIPRRPIRRWQIWNEPNLAYYWRQPFAAGYAALLRDSRRAIRRADPGAQTVLGALTNRAWVSLVQLYRANHGPRGLFDVAAVNGFTEDPANVIVYMRYVRNALNRYGERGTPLLATEVSWPASTGHVRRKFSFSTTAAGQARKIAALLPLIGANYRSLNLIGFDYYTWIGDEVHNSNPFGYAGLLADRGGTVHVKPALGAFRRGALALEHCARKGAVATSCRR